MMPPISPKWEGSEGFEAKCETGAGIDSDNESTAVSLPAIGSPTNRSNIPVPPALPAMQQLRGVYKVPKRSMFQPKQREKRERKSIAVSSAKPELRCPRCGMQGFDTAKDLGKHTVNCKKGKSEKRTGKPPLDRLGSVLLETKNESTRRIREGKQMENKIAEEGELPVLDDNINESKYNMDDWTTTEVEGYSRAHLAVYNFNHEELTEIINNGGEIDMKDPEGQTPMHFCGRYDNAKACKILLKLARKKAKKCLEAKDSKGKTPLYLACENNHLNVASLLLMAGKGYVNTPDKKGNTALHACAKKGVRDCAELLLHYGADPDGPPNHLGSTPSHVVYDIDTFQTLLDHGADLNALDLCSRSLAFNFCTKKKPKLLTFLIDVDGGIENLEYPDCNGDTPLHAAASSESYECMESLLQCAVDPAPKNNSGISPADICARLHLVSHLQLLQSYCSETEVIAKRAGIDLETGELMQSLEWSHDIWKECLDPESGFMYYWNMTTGEVTWDKPANATIEKMDENTTYADCSDDE